MTSTATILAPQPTGNLLVMFQPGQKPKQIDRLVSNTLGLKNVAHSSDFNTLDSRMVDAFAESGVLNLDRIGIAVVATQPGSAMAVATANLNADKNVRVARPEFWLRARSAAGTTATLPGSATASRFWPIQPCARTVRRPC